MTDFVWMDGGDDTGHQGWSTPSQAAEKVEKQIPRRPGRPPRDDNNKRLATAQLKLRPFKTFHNRLFPQPVQACITGRISRRALTPEVITAAAKARYQ
jgi:hypothetical protein